MSTKKTIMLMRHAEAIKNKQDKHGGAGSDLVEDAQKSIEVTAKKIGGINISFKKIIYSPQIQCEQSAEILSSLLNIPAELFIELQPIHLGIIDGLSNAEVEKFYPEIAYELRRWRNSEIEINQLAIPNMENYSTFFERGLKIINLLSSKNESIIILTSRSILVLLSSILLRRSIEKGGNYREIRWRNLDYLLFTVSEIGTSLHIDLSTVKI